MPPRSEIWMESGGWSHEEGCQINQPMYGGMPKRPCTIWPSIMITMIVPYKDEVLDVLFDLGADPATKDAQP